MAFFTEGVMKLTVNTKQRSYPILMEHGILKRAAEVCGDIGRPFLISDDGVPGQWRDILQAQFPDAPMHVIPQGEASKSFPVFQEVLEDMLAHHVSRNDTVIALGGGVVGDFSGFAAACYMRGIRYINIPTTSLSQIDSSIGGKTAIDLAGVKNSVGAFWQPAMVLIDTDTLSTLPERHLSNGLAEAVKAGVILDRELFELFERDDWKDHLDEIIERSLLVKKRVVEEDERETGLRRLLNYGHTFGHAYESCYDLQTYLHGECVAMGMMTMAEDAGLRERLEKVLRKLNLPLSCSADPAEVVSRIHNDKKADHAEVTVIVADRIGHSHQEKWTMAQIERKAGL